MATSFEQLHRNIGYTLEAGFKGVMFWSIAFPADKMALFVASADSWNYAGRSLDETLRSYAATIETGSPERYMAAYRLYDKANHYVSFKNSINSAATLAVQGLSSWTDSTRSDRLISLIP